MKLCRVTSDTGVAEAETVSWAEAAGMTTDGSECVGKDGPDRQELEHAFRVFMERAVQLESSYQALQAKVHELTDELAVKVREICKLRDHLANVLESVADAVLVVDVEGRVTSLNRAAGILFSCREEWCVGRTVEEIGEAAMPLAVMVRKLLAEGERRKTAERQIRNASGRTMVLLLSVASLRDAAGCLAGAVASAQDVTQLRDLERALARRERLAALGEMAAVLAHEIRNPLGGIQLYAGVLARAEPLGVEERAVVEKLSRGVSGLNRLVDDMLAFAREIVVSKTMQDVRLAVEGALEQVAAAADTKEVVVTRRHWARSLEAPVDADLIRRAVVNILLNAIEAVSNGGHVEVVGRYESGPNGRQLILEVSDDGPGIAPGEMELIFNPFHTTKAQGTGLGLAVVSRIAVAHGGEVLAACRAKGGTTIALRLPAGT